jgi:hypothetical protein
MLPPQQGAMWLEPCASQANLPPMITYEIAPPLRHLTVKNRMGSRQHYYHFLLGVLLPLADYLARTGEATLPMMVRSCGPLDAILYELQLPRLMISDTESHQNLGDSLSPEVARKVGIVGFDIGLDIKAYDGEPIIAGARWVAERLAAAIATHREQLMQTWPATPRILIIDRGPPDPFYANSARSSRPTRGVGAQRRRVANHAEMAAAVKQRYPGAVNILLENRPLAAQIALFQLADVVVAQHGAALTNMVWMRRGTSVIELAGGMPANEPFFTALTPHLGLRHLVFPQEGAFGPVDGVALAAAIGKMVGGMQVAG